MPAGVVVQPPAPLFASSPFQAVGQGRVSVTRQPLQARSTTPRQVLAPPSVAAPALLPVQAGSSTARARVLASPSMPVSTPMPPAPLQVSPALSGIATPSQPSLSGTSMTAQPFQNGTVAGSGYALGVPKFTRVVAPAGQQVRTASWPVPQFLAAQSPAALPIQGATPSAPLPMPVVRCVSSASRTDLLPVTRIAGASAPCSASACTLLPQPVVAPVSLAGPASAYGAPLVSPARPSASATPSSAVPVEPASRKEPHDLVLMTLNLQYFSSYPDDEDAGRRKLEEATGGDYQPDVICVQEGLACKDVISPVGYTKVVCSAAKGFAQSVREMVYSDPPTLKICKEAYHDEFLCNQIYVRSNSQWKVQDQGVLPTTSDLQLAGGGGRAEGKLAIRSMVWVKLQVTPQTQHVYVMCTHITGGRFEDQYFIQQLKQERFDQLDRMLSWFEGSRPDKKSDDVGILLGDFNATMEYLSDGPMHGYFKASIGSSAGVKEDIARLGYGDSEQHTEDQFQMYMISPFDAINSHDWKMVYREEREDDRASDDPNAPIERRVSTQRASMNSELVVMKCRVMNLQQETKFKVTDPTSGFGHVIDHMAYYDKTNSLHTKSVEVKFLTNQKFSKQKHTDVAITDHNSVKVRFTIGEEDP